MSPTNNLITVVIPCFNNEATISETIESVIQQTNANWELICVDDGSQDNTLPIIHSYITQDDRIKLIVRAKDPKGGSHCRNIGAFSAKGEYVIFLDADDLLAPSCLERRLNAIIQSNFDFVVFPMARFSNNINNAKVYSNLYAKDFKYYFASSFAAWQVTSPLFRIDFFKSLNGFDIFFPRLQDVEFHLRALLQTNNYKVYQNFNPDCFYRYSKATNKINIKKFENCLFAYKKYISLISDNLYKFENKKKLSKSILCLLSCVIFTINIIKINKGNSLTLEQINTKHIDRFLIKKELYIYYLIKNIPTSYLKIILSFLLRKYLIITKL